MPYPAAPARAAVSRRRAALALALLLGLQPITTDLYLPALPALTRDLAAPIASAQLTMAALILAFGIAQMVWGPVADRVGRRPVLLAGLLLYSAASLACTLAGSMATLVLWRTLQGAALAAAVVCARAIVRDLYEPDDGARVMSLALSGLGIIALTAPLVGGFVAAAAGWRAALALVTAAGVAILAFIALRLPETLQQTNPQATRLAMLLPTWWAIARHPSFVAWSLLVACTYGGIFLMLAGSSFVYIDVFGLSPAAYGGAMAMASLCYLAGTVVCRRWIARHGQRRHRLARRLVHRRRRRRDGRGTAGWRSKCVGLAAAAMAVHVRARHPPALWPGRDGGAVCARCRRGVGARRAAAGAGRVRHRALARRRARRQPAPAGAGAGVLVGAGLRGGLAAGSQAGPRGRRSPRRRCRRDRALTAMPPAPPALCLAGPTAAGKTAVALALAERLPIEIISVDSALVYRGMDIGTAKPSAAERAAVPHHLIDIVDPTDAYSAARFVADATRLVGEIRGRGRLPLLVGGTMLYVKALRDGLSEMPAADAAVRAQIDAEAAARGAGRRCTPTWRRSTLQPPRGWRPPTRSASSARSRSGASAAGRCRRGSAARKGRRPRRRWAAFRWCRLSRHRAPGCTRGSPTASTRCSRPGCCRKCRRCGDRGDLHADLPAMRCVGYRQAWAALEAGSTAALRDTGIAATRQLAKRQLTWLRSMPHRHAVACDAPDAQQQALRLLERLAGG